MPTPLETRLTRLQQSLTAALTRPVLPAVPVVPVTAADLRFLIAIAWQVDENHFPCGVVGCPTRPQPHCGCHVLCEFFEVVSSA